MQRDKPFELLTPKQTAAKLGISLSTLAKWRLFGFGPRFVKIGSRVAYDVGIVETWIASRFRRSTSDAGDETGS